MLNRGSDMAIFNMKIRILLVLCLLVSTAISEGQTNQQQAVADSVVQNGGTLHDAAIAAGGKYRTLDVDGDGWVDYGTLKSLARDSDLIVVGTPIENVCDLSNDGKAIRTYYKVRVEDSFRGGHKSGELITVVLPGGMYTWPDGATVKISTPRFKRMVNGNRYLLYLAGRQNKKRDAPDYFATGGSQGLFELKNDGSVQPHAYSEHPLKRIHWKDQHEFLEAVRASTNDNQR